MFHKLISKSKPLTNEDLRLIDSFTCPTCSNSLAKVETKELKFATCEVCSSKFMLELKNVKDMG
jgi:transcription elongation factor Elf1